eukprot:gene8490-4851_t
MIAKLSGAAPALSSARNPVHGLIQTTQPRVIASASDRCNTTMVCPLLDASSQLSTATPTAMVNSAMLQCIHPHKSVAMACPNCPRRKKAPKPKPKPRPFQRSTTASSH